jgi:hypothetical protein
MDIKHFVVYEVVEYFSNGCDCCEPDEFTYYTFDNENLDLSVCSMSYIQDIPIEISEFLGYHIPEHLDEYEERVEYATTMLSTLGITWEIKQEV